MINGLIGKKLEQSQKFLEDGTRVPVTVIEVLENPVIFYKTKEKDGYEAIQLGYSINKHANKSMLGHVRGAKLQKAPRFLREIRQTLEVASLPKIGEFIKPSSVFSEGDIVDVAGVSKGKGFAGVVKRHHFKGGPRTHGQSDRERAPGSIGQTTTPGRVYKGKRMAGKMGAENVKVKNLSVLQVTDSCLIVKGLVPGGKNNMLVIKKVGRVKKFVPMYKEKEENSSVKNN